MSTFEEILLKEQHGQFNSPDLKVEKSIIHAAEKRLATTVLVGLIGSILAILGHHWFLFLLDSRHAEAQFWIKTASNAFSQVVVLFMGLVVTSSLTQSVWKALTKEYTQISIIDNLFSLPEPLSILSIGARLKRRLILPLGLSLFIQSLVTVSILAPNSLTVSLGQRAKITSLIPVVNFFGRIPNLGTINGPYSENWIDRTIRTPLGTYWEPPTGCEASCQIQIQYQAPALSCRELRNDELRLSSDNETNIERVFYDAGDSPSSTEWGNPYPGFWVNYAPHPTSIIDNSTGTAINPTAPISGIQCNFRDGNYQATFELADGVKSVTASIMSYNDGPVAGCNWADSQLTPSRCGDYSTNANTLYAAFLSEFMATGVCFNINNMWQCKIYPFGPSMATYMNEPSSTELGDLFKTSVSNLADSVEDLYSNATLAAMLSIGDMETGYIFASDGQKIWNYSRSTFWIIYGIALALTLVIALDNFILIANHNVGINNEFSSILISTQSKELDKLCATSGDTKMEARLRFSADRLLFDIEESSSVHQSLLDGATKDSTNPSIQSKSESVVSINTQRANGIHPDKLALTTMIAAYLMAILFSFGHHLFLWKINDTLVSHYSQFWVKNVSNGLAHGVSLSLGLVATYSLVHVIWRAVGAAPASVAVINRLFSLPATEAYFRFLVSSWRLDWVPAGLIVLATYMLLLVTIFAPNALTVGTSRGRAIQISIPLWNFNSSVFGGGYNPETSNILPAQIWTKPPECDAICDFEFEYEAPAIVCTDYHYNFSFNSDSDADQWAFIVSNYSTSYYVANMTEEQYEHAPGILNEIWELKTTRTIWIQYIPSVVQMVNSTPVVKSISTPIGSLCQYQDATYRAKFHISDNATVISTHPKSYHDSFGIRCPWDVMDSPDSECEMHGSSSLLMAYYFSQYIFQNISAPFYSWSAPVSLMSLGIVDFRDNVTGDGTYSLRPKVSNISEHIVGLFSNYTLNILSYASGHRTIDAFTWGNTVWKYEVSTLWIIYGAAHAIILVILLYGLYCIHANGMPLDKKFSTLMVATRGDKLNDLVENTEGYEALKAVELRYESKEGFIVVEQEEEESKDDMELLPL